MENILNSLLSHVKQEYQPLNGFIIAAKDIVFEERVKMNCFYCGRYNKSWKCPPYLPSLDYPRMISEFDNIAAIYLKMDFDVNNYADVRTNSSVTLHKALLQMEQYLWEHNNSTALSFIGGSCKLCKNGCGEVRCNNPYKARSPIEATGINIIKTVDKYGLKIEFPPPSSMLRIGLLLW